MHNCRPRLGIMSAPAISCSTPAGTKFRCDYPEADHGSGSGQCVEVRALAVSAAVSSAAPGAAAPCRKTLADQRLGSDCVTWRWQRHGPAGRPGCDHRAGQPAGACGALKPAHHKPHPHQLCLCSATTTQRFHPRRSIPAAHSLAARSALISRVSWLHGTVLTQACRTAGRGGGAVG